ncbi:IMP dehydrogenase [Candidatus Parcubacteria bacterium A4]|nr:MAG: IMP dehydrogenase [Candidatus Parcubacteria bacterium A4]
MEKIIKDAFFEKIEALGLALTFDDVRLRSGHSEVMPDDVNLESKFSKNISLKIPFVSADMDTVTESDMAIGMALLGGIGVIHKNLSPEEQAEEVIRVKHYLNGFISKPICVQGNELVRDVLARKAKNKYNFCTFPVVDVGGRLIGILSKTDFDFCLDTSLSVSKIMSAKVITAPEGTSLKEAYKIMTAKKKKVLPLLDEKEKVAGLYVFKDVQRVMMKNPAGCNIDKNEQLIVAAAVGVNDFERVDLLVKNKVNALVISTAHADTKSVIETLKEIKRNYKIDVIAGNVSEPESALRLAKAGVDGIKVGQGPGSICTTRIIAGIGSPQVSAVYKCVRAVRGLGVPICADGGLRSSGDIVIALGAGAHSVMMGNMLAGTKEAPGEIFFKDGRQWKIYRGMGSIGAMESGRGSRERYRQADTGKKDLISEGVEGLKPYKGELEQVIFQYLGGLKRGMGYVGAADISEFREKADFIRITSAGKTESHPHDIIITKEPPNYSLES